MASELGFSPPEVPEPTFLEHVLRYGLFLGAVFQLVCILAIVFPAAKPHQPVRASPLGAYREPHTGHELYPSC
uniref:Mannosidase beta like n=1 Tax=Ornithorhynchus anatinus TaxID=9258 RepID=F6TTH3_ORNAN